MHSFEGAHVSLAAKPSSSAKLQFVLLHPQRMCLALQAMLRRVTARSDWACNLVVLPHLLQLSHLELTLPQLLAYHCQAVLNGLHLRGVKRLSLVLVAASPTSATAEHAASNWTSAILLQGQEVFHGVEVEQGVELHEFVTSFANVQLLLTREALKRRHRTTKPAFPSDMLSAMFRASYWAPCWLVVVARRANSLDWALDLRVALLRAAAIGHEALLTDLENEVAVAQGSFLLAYHIFQLQLPVQWRQSLDCRQPLNTWTFAQGAFHEIEEETVACAIVPRTNLDSRS